MKFVFRFSLNYISYYKNIIYTFQQERKINDKEMVNLIIPSIALYLAFAYKVHSLPPYQDYALSEIIEDQFIDDLYTSYMSINSPMDQTDETDENRYTSVDESNDMSFFLNIFDENEGEKDELNKLNLNKDNSNQDTPTSNDSALSPEDKRPFIDMDKVIFEFPLHETKKTQESVDPNKINIQKPLEDAERPSTKIKRRKPVHKVDKKTRKMENDEEAKRHRKAMHSYNTLTTILQMFYSGEEVNRRG